MDQSAIPSRHAQRGAVLLVSVVLLFILTFLGLVAMKIATLEEKMSGAAMDKNVAFQAAESALRDGEQDVLNNLTSSSGFSAACMTGLCLPSTTAVAICDSISWTGGLPRNYGSYTGAAAIPDVLTQPKYIVELLPDLPPEPAIACPRRCAHPRRAAVPPSASPQWDGANKAARKSCCKAYMSNSSRGPGAKP